MTLLEMQEDLLTRLYTNTIHLVDSGDLSDAEKNRVLHEAANVFGFSLRTVRTDA